VLSKIIDKWLLGFGGVFCVIYSNESKLLFLTGNVSNRNKLMMKHKLCIVSCLLLLFSFYPNA